MSLGSLLLLASMTSHTLGALAWVGSLLFAALVLSLPWDALALDRRLMLLRRGRWALALGLLVILPTGVWNTMYNPALRPPPGVKSALGLVPSVTNWDQLQELKETPYGYALYVKHLLILASIAVSFVTHFVLQRRLAQTSGGLALAGAVPASGPAPPTGWADDAPKQRQLQQQMFWLATLNVGLGALIVSCAVYMVYTLH